jgi:hypothetical protein
MDGFYIFVPFLSTNLESSSKIIVGWQVVAVARVGDVTPNVYKDLVNKVKK